MSKPKVAICFAGLPSFIDHNKGYWQELIDRYDADVYASLWEDEQKLVNESDTIDNFVDSYKPLKLELENYEDLQNSTFRYLAEDLVNHKEEGKTWQETLFELQGSYTESQANNSIVGRNFSMFYKIWKANLLKDSLGKKYDIVVRAETCSSFPDLSLDRVDDYEAATECISMPYFLERLPFLLASGDKKPVLNPWVVFGPPDLMDYYCSMFLYLKKYSCEVIMNPPNAITVHHLLNRPSLRLRLFFSKIFRKGIMQWNGMTNSYDAHESTGEEEPEIDKNSFYTTMGNFHKHFTIKDSIPLKPNYRDIVNINKVVWQSKRPPQEKPKSEKAYVGILESEGHKTSLQLKDYMINYLMPVEPPSFNVEITQDEYGNFYPKYTKKHKGDKNSVSPKGLSLAHYISEELNSQGVKIWLAYGSSLGAVREGKMIEGDENDLDMMMWEEDKDELMQVIKDSPYVVFWDLRFFPENGGEICKLSLVNNLLPKGEKPLAKAKKSEGHCWSCNAVITEGNHCQDCIECHKQFHIDVFFLKRTPDNIKCYDSCYPNVYFKSYHYENLRKIKFENLDFYVSKYAEDTLDFFYNGIDGTDNTWRVPIERDFYYSKGYDCCNVPGQESVFTCYIEGVFDLFHKGHVRLLKRASKIFDKVIAGVTPDEITATYKDSTPIIPFEDRKEMLESCKYVDEIIAPPENSIYTVDWLNNNNIDYVCHGRKDNEFLRHWYRELMDESRLFLFDETPDYHTTDLRERISK